MNRVLDISINERRNLIQLSDKKRDSRIKARLLDMEYFENLVWLPDIKTQNSTSGHPDHNSEHSSKNKVTTLPPALRPPESMAFL